MYPYSIFEETTCESKLCDRLLKCGQSVLQEAQTAIDVLNASRTNEQRAELPADEQSEELCAVRH